MMTALSDSYAVLDIFMPVTGVKKGHDTLCWLMCLPPFSIFLQLLHSLLVRVLFLLYWAHALPTLMSALLENLTLHCGYCFLEWNDDSPFRQLCCTGYLYACYRHKDRQYIIAAWQGCHNFIESDNNNNARLKFQAEQTEGLEGHGIEITGRKQPQTMNIIAEGI